MRRMLSGLVRRHALAFATGIAAAATLLASGAAEAQEIQLTGPLAGAPAVRKMRLHREGRFEIAPGASFTLLDEYQRTILPGGSLTFHPTDWFGFGLWGGVGLQSTTALTDELQEKAVDNRNCAGNPSQDVCRLTQFNITREGPGTGSLAADQLGKIQWIGTAQLVFIPFRGKIALFSALFLDTDVSIYVGGGAAGLQEREECGSSGSACSESFALKSRLAFAPMAGLGFNLYPSDFISFGIDFRAMPFAWNTSGFDTKGAGNGGDFPDTNVDGNDRALKVNPMIGVHIGLQLPTGIKTSE